MLNGLIFPDDCMHSSLCVLTTAWIPLYFPRPSINTCPTQLFQNFSFPLKPPTPTLPSYSQLHSLLTHVVIQPVGKLKQFQEKLPQVLTLHLVPYHSLCTIVLGFPTYYLKWSVLGFHLYWLHLDAWQMHHHHPPPSLVAYNNKHEWSHSFCGSGIESLSWIVLVESLLCSCD